MTLFEDIVDLLKMDEDKNCQRDDDQNQAERSILEKSEELYMYREQKRFGNF